MSRRSHGGGSASQADRPNPALSVPVAPFAVEVGLGDRALLGEESLRQRTARGTVVNGAFMVGVISLSLVRGFVVAAFLSPRQYGVWGVLAIAAGTMLTLKQVGIGDKYIQQSERSQQEAFQKAFTLELAATGAAMAALLLVLPLLALVYGQPELLLPGIVLALAPLGVALQSPTWVYYRRMDFVRQRRLQSVDPVMAFVVTVALAIAGAGYWSLVVGSVVGAWAGGLVAVRASPYKLALRHDRGSLRDYAAFSWPLLLASLAPVVMAQAAALVGAQVVGIAGVGAIVLAVSISDYTNRVDAIVTETLYPAICAVRDRTDLLLESFIKSNRLALMWGVPFGIGLALFAPDLVDALGVRWRPAVGLIQAFGVIAAVNHIGFNWDAFFRARGRTRPIAVWSLATLASFLLCTLPLLIVDGLDGFAIGMAVMTAVSLIVRAIYLKRLLPDLRVLRHTMRAMAPVVPGVAIVLLARAAESAHRSAALVAVELIGYCAVVALATSVLERSLLAEMVGYLRRTGDRGASATAASDGAVTEHGRR